MNDALLFPGQGSQRVGMGREVAAQSAAARAVYAEADEALGLSISNLCFEGPEERLQLTEFTQPAILTTSIAVLRALQERGEVAFDVCAGHSLGEFSALVAAGALSLADAVRLVHLRGRAMQEAVPAGIGGMAALMGLSQHDTTALCDEIRGQRVCAPANLNGGGQVVISGHLDAVEEVVAVAKERGAKRAVMLKVSAPFHSAMVIPARASARRSAAGLISAL
ncbi:MAG: ACP S-malonyltransferase [Myxococcota bacterium]